MTASHPIPIRFIGCDVGKSTVVVFDSATAQTRSVPNTPAALSAFALSLDPTCLVVCEATGGYEAALLAATVSAGCPAHRADARKVKAFIRSFGTLGKTDVIDARALAHYGAERHARLLRWTAPDKSRVQLQLLVLTRRDVVAQRQAWANRLSAPGAEAAVTYLRAILDCLDVQIDELDRDIDALIRQETALRMAEAALRAIVGIGRSLARPHARTRTHQPTPSRSARWPRATPKSKRNRRALPTRARRTPRSQTRPVHGIPRRR